MALVCSPLAAAVNVGLYLVPRLNIQVDGFGGVGVILSAGPEASLSFNGACGRGKAGVIVNGALKVCVISNVDLILDRSPSLHQYFRDFQQRLGQICESFKN